MFYGTTDKYAAGRHASQALVAAYVSIPEVAGIIPDPSNLDVSGVGAEENLFPRPLTLPPPS